MVFSSKVSLESSGYFEKSRSVCFGLLRTDSLPKGSQVYRSCGSGFFQKYL
ncbi:hypothetical protein Gotri_001146 [Gossypium trilobum]|uniref:Uncharacterized protein n=1 Tax=Gossypium trilobum TaxID=34281 RepID=A0A7J9FEN5_9ROSI|nr:hypothetical protein [Gossypium trilobum]